ncbi:MAG TPA: nuclear transport factor 2 family protein [Methylotenera sp.]|nr:nuclear transport factor 2 family protein [Methylotenera sp.]
METISRENMDKLINDHFMYEATDDIEGVLRTFTDDVEHQVVGGPDGPLRGKAVLRRFYERLFSDLRGEGVEPVMRLYGDDFLIDETIWIGQVVDGRPFNLEGRSGKARIRLLHVFKLRDGRIAKENVWFDFDEIKRQLA